MLRDLYRHQEWADAEIWRACEAHPGAMADPELWVRQHHIHLVQQAFLHIVRGEDASTLTFRKAEEYSGPAELKHEAQRHHAAFATLVDKATEEILERGLVIPWFQDPPLTLTTREALLQAAMHSQHHRGQQSARLRALGGTPPLLDYIFWIWKGRPAPQWS